MVRGYILSKSQPYKQTTIPESCFLVATRSTYTPTSTPEQLKSNSVDLTMPLTMPPAVPEPAVLSDWEAWRDENTIEICEISVSTAGSALC